MAARRRRGGRGTPWVTVLFGVLSVVLAGAAIFLWLRGDEPALVAPTALPGENELIHVEQALSAEGLAVTIEPRGIAPGALGVPGQLLTVDGVPLYVFVYPSAEAAATPAARVDPASALPASNPAGTPIATQPPHLARGSNVIVALVGGDDQLRAKVDAAVASLR